MGCSPAELVHVCAGSVSGGRLTLDIRPSTAPDVVADARWLPLRPGSARFILTDPPYSAEHAEALYGVGKQYPQPIVLLRECAEVL